MIVRVLPDVSGFDKEFDYSVPPELEPKMCIGAMVRVELAGRRVNAWVTAVDPEDADTGRSLLPLLKWRGLGPTQEVLSSAEVIASRYMGRRRSLLSTASPDPLVHTLPATRRHESPPGGGPFADLARNGGGLIRCGLNQDVAVVVRSVARLGPMLCVVPNFSLVRTLAASLRGSGFSVAVFPDEWAQAVAGADIVIGTRAAVWAPVSDIATVIIWDEHDESLNEERVPTWNAREVGILRASKLGAACFLASPIPTPQALHWAADRIYRTAEADLDAWGSVRVVDISPTEEVRVPAMFSSEFLACARDNTLTVLGIVNSTGVARLLSCRQCNEIAKCEACGSVVIQSKDDLLHCGACGLERPLVCSFCGAGAFKNLRRGVSRVRSELERACGRPVHEITGSSQGESPQSGPFVAVGTEAILHRVQSADVIAFLDFDSEMDSGFYRANEIALGLVARALRVASQDGFVIVQTKSPNRNFLDLLAVGSVDALIEREYLQRRDLALPPYSVLVKISGTASDEWFSNIKTLPLGCDVNQRTGLVRAPDFESMRGFLDSVEIPRSGKVRFEVQPLRA